MWDFTIALKLNLPHQFLFRMPFINTGPFNAGSDSTCFENFSGLAHTKSPFLTPALL